MYKLTFTLHGEKRTKYFLTLSEAREYCGFFGWNPARIKPVH